jgi:hypothetical protein
MKKNRYYHTIDNDDGVKIKKLYGAGTFYLYDYFLQNIHLPIFFKSNNTILKELNNTISLRTLIRYKNNLIDIGVLEELEHKEGSTKRFKIHRLSNAKKINNDIIDNTGMIEIDISPVSKNVLNKEKTIDDLFFEKQKEDFNLNPNINNLNINKFNKENACVNKESISNIYPEHRQKTHEFEKPHTQKEYLNTIKQNSNPTNNLAELEANNLLAEIKSLFEKYASHRMQELTCLELPNTLTQTISKLTNLNKKIIATKNNYKSFFKWLRGNEKARDFITVAKIYNVINTVDNQFNWYLKEKERLKKEEEDKHKYTYPPEKEVSVDEVLRRIDSGYYDRLEEERKKKENL